MVEESSMFGHCLGRHRLERDTKGGILRLRVALRQSAVDVAAASALSVSSVVTSSARISD
jgi:hypothetical protein